MQNDEVIWQIINKHFCAFKYTTPTKENFCKNDKNVTGLCNRTSCPLANSHYGTVIEKDGVCYLYLKTVERAHTPAKMWEKIKLSKNLEQAIEQINTHMKNVYSEKQIHRCKKRLNRLRQMLTRMRRMELKPQTQLVPVKKKTERREAIREKKAEQAANVDSAIEKELLSRLQNGTYGDLYVVPNKAEDDQLVEAEGAQQDDRESTMMIDEQDFDNMEFVEGEDSDFEGDFDDMEEDEEEEEEEEGEEDMHSLSSDDAQSDESDTDISASTKTSGRLNGRGRSNFGQRKRARVEIEYEEERDVPEKLADF